MVAAIDRKQFFALYRKGLTFADIARKLNCPAYEVCRFARRNGVLPRRVQAEHPIPLPRPSFAVGDWIDVEVPIFSHGETRICDYERRPGRIAQAYPRFYLTHVPTPGGYIRVCQHVSSSRRSASGGNVCH